MAIATAETDTRRKAFAADAEQCDAGYEAALAALQEGDIETARIHLENARRIEKDGGDDQDARRALAAVADLDAPISD